LLKTGLYGCSWQEASEDRTLSPANAQTGEHGHYIDIVDPALMTLSGSCDSSRGGAMSLSRPARMAPVRIEIARLHFGCASATLRQSKVDRGRRRMATRANGLLGGAVVAAAMAAFSPSAVIAGPPFQTDDPEPVPYQHFEFYTFSIGTAVRGDPRARRRHGNSTMALSPTGSSTS